MTASAATARLSAPRRWPLVDGDYDRSAALTAIEHQALNALLRSASAGPYPGLTLDMS
ncbi:MAG: hypothetical protein ACYDAG_09535 [Chloroflexota bacterium]